MKTHIVSLSLSLFLVMFPAHVFSHSGGLDKSGGHYNRKTGEYHYHGGKPQEENSRTIDHSTNLSIIPQPIKQERTNHIKEAKVVGISDGDTITVVIDGEQNKIRLYGIDSPESGQDFGQAAKKAIKQIIGDRHIQIEQKGTDKYGRTIAMVYADGKSVNEIMVKGGYAWVYDQYCSENVCDEWRGYQSEAKSLKRAMWIRDDITPPWEWRREQKNK